MPACGRNAEERAAEQALDACIAALQPVSDGRPPAPDVLAGAVRAAEEAALADDSWDTLVGTLRRARAAAGTPGAGAAIDALVAECDRSNELVRRGGRVESRT